MLAISRTFVFVRICFLIFLYTGYIQMSSYIFAYTSN
jgi:hypothetical protein